MPHKPSIMAEPVPVLESRLQARRQLVRLCFGRCQSWGNTCGVQVQPARKLKARLMSLPD